jgi:isopenicillin-N N-acyltransferase-like protein
MLAGLAEALALPYDDLILYTLSSYLRDRHQVNAAAAAPALLLRDGAEETGCTTWAASGAATLEGRPMLVKNRDYHRDHIPLQTLARVTPEQGLSLSLHRQCGAAPRSSVRGSTSGGLAVADTHVLSRQIGPGLPRFSLMRELLAHHASAASALDYLRSVPHMGAGTRGADRRGGPRAGLRERPPAERLLCCSSRRAAGEHQSLHHPGVGRHLGGR